MRATKVVSGVGLTALLIGTVAVADPAGAQEKARQRAPIVRIYSENGVDMISTSTYVQPVIDVSENAYVFAVAMDLDGQIQVLHPDFPGLSVRLLARKQVRLPNFFAGFNRRAPGGNYYSASYLYDYADGYDDSRGTVIALASRAPFNLEKIEVDGDWNMSAIRRLISGRSPLAAAQALAAYLGAQGEPIGRDFMRFAGNQRYYNDRYYGYSAYNTCDAFYGYGFAPLQRAQVYSRINQLTRSGRGFRIVGYDLCGVPIVVAGRSGSLGSPLPSTRPPRNPGDTTVFPKARGPRSGTPRHPRDTEANSAPEGIFPLPGRAGLPQIGDVTVTAPRTRHPDPAQVLQGYRPSPGIISAPQGRAPVERTVVPHRQPAASGAAAPVYRPEPRVQTPPPSRVPDAPRAAPAPAPVHRDAPPPRAQTPAPNTEPARSSPPRRQQ